MLHYAVVFLVIALIAAVLGFGFISGIAGTIAQVCCYLFIILFVISLITGRKGPIA